MPARIHGMDPAVNAAERAQLDQINAQADATLDRMIARYREAMDMYGVAAVDMMDNHLQGPPWRRETLATLAAFALRRLAGDTR